jgi:hypothetical protein
VLAATEITARLLVANITAQQVETNLPEQVTADVRARPGGVCVACELLGGSLSQLDVATDDLTFGEITGDAEVSAFDVELGDPVVVGSLEGSIGINETELNDLLQQVAADAGIEIHSVELRDDGIGYSTEVDVFGSQVGISVVANLEPRSGGRLRVVANSIQISSGDATTQVDLDPSRFSFQMCLAEHLPAAVQLTSVVPSAQHLDINFRSTSSVRLDDQAFAELGGCN